MKLNIVPAATGIQWVQLGMRTFMKQPLALAALVFLYLTLSLLMLVVPLVGPFLMMAIMPLGTLGLMAATKEAENSAFPMPTVLFTGLRASRDRVRSMLLLGALYAASLLVLVLVVTFTVQVPTDTRDPAQVLQSGEFRFAMLLTAALYLPISLAFWHAPALVHWHGVTPGKSLFFSLVACIRNARAFLMYGLVWAGVALGVIVASNVAGLVSPWLSGVVFGAASTMATITFYTSLYFTFRDSFIAEADNSGDAQ